MHSGGIVMLINGVLISLAFTVHWVLQVTPKKKQRETLIGALLNPIHLLDKLSLI